MTQAALIDTRTAAKRRELHFSSPAEVIAEAERLAAADRAGRLDRTGNWTSGQVFAHVAAWASYPYDGYPMKRPPLVIRAISRAMKSRFLNKPMPAGFRIPDAPGGTFGQDEVSTDEGLARLKAAFGRLARGDAPTHASPVFGPMSIDEVRRLNLRHAELHLGFLHPR